MQTDENLFSFSLSLSLYLSFAGVGCMYLNTIHSLASSL